MGDAADMARDTEEFWEELWAAHRFGNCVMFEDCPFCNPDFEPLFTFQYPRKRDGTGEF